MCVCSVERCGVGMGVGGGHCFNGEVAYSQKHRELQTAVCN